MLSANIVTSAAQALLAAYIAHALWRGASTSARRRLASAVASLAVYAAVLTVFYALRSKASQNVVSLTAMVFAVVGAAHLVTYASWMARGSKRDEPPRTSPFVVAAGVASVLVATAGIVHTLQGGTPTLHYVLLLASMVGLFGSGVVVLTRARLRGDLRVGSLILACALPLVPLILGVLQAAKLPISEDVFVISRDLAMLACWYAILASYLDHGQEPLSLRERLVAGALTLVLAVLTVATHVAVPFVSRHAPDAASGEAAARTLALSLLGVLALALALPTLVLPRLLRGSVLLPLDRLAAGLRRVEAGELVAIPVDHDDEIGAVTRSFNGMSSAIAEGRDRLGEQVRALETRGREVEELNQELQRQVAARSRQLSELLARVDPTGGALELGSLVDDRYRVEERLGAGGMGVVYAVVRITDGRQLALKVMSSGTSRDDGVRFAREAEIAAGLDHENLVTVIDVGMHRGLPYLVMERIDGGSLDGRRDRFGELGWALPLLQQVARGLAALHAHRIVHRDLKPANVLLRTKEGRLIATITDFGIARSDAISAFAATASAESGTQPRAGVTASGALIGTLAYMAPELAGGVDSFRPAADVFALGIIAYEMLGGDYPFRLPPLLDVLARGELPELPALPAALPVDVAAAIRAALSLDPAARPTASALAAAFGSAAVAA